MINQQIINYITQQLQQGQTKDAIKSALLANGWQNNDIEEAFILIESIKSPQKYSKKVLKILGWASFAFIFFIAIFLALPYILAPFGKDIPPIDDTDLQLQQINVPDGENAYFDLTKLENNVYETKEVIDYLEGKAWDDKQVEDILAKNEQSLIYFTNAVAKPKFQNPISANPDNIKPGMEMPAMKDWRAISRIAALKALYLNNAGHSLEGLLESSKLLVLGQMIQDSQLSLLEYLIAVNMKNLGLETMQKILSASNLPLEIYTGYSQALEDFKQNEAGLINALKVEYLNISYRFSDEQIIESLLSDSEINISESQIRRRIHNNFYFQPNQTKKLAIEHFRNQISKISTPCNLTDSSKKCDICDNPILIYFTENAVGKILFSIIAVDLVGTREKVCQENFLISATQLMFAMKTYKITTGQLPEKLEDLVPKYITKIPQDSFSDEPIKYSANKKIIYSVGKDKIDSGGSEGTDWRTMPDPTFKIDF